MMDFLGIDSAPADTPVMVRLGETMAKARYASRLDAWTYATDDPDYVSRLSFAPDRWRALTSDEQVGVAMDPPSAPDAPRIPEDER